MRVAVLSWGTRGDLQPYLALAQGFAAAGHEVRFGCPPNAELAALARELEVPWVPLGDAIEMADVARTTRRARGYPDAIRQLRVFFDELLLPSLERTFAASLELGRWADVIVSHALQPAGRMAAEALDRPFVTGTVVPTMLPFGGPHARLAFRVATFFMNASWAPGINSVRRRVGLPSLRDLVGDGLYSPHLNLVATSPLVFDAPASWWPRHRLTGYWFVRRPTWRVPDEVAAFFERGPRPVYVGFGSMPSPDPRRLTRIVLQSLDKAGLRGVLEPGAANLGEGALPVSAMTVAGVPHEWLFERVAAVVHHGGAGTSGAAFRAGTPSVVVPHWVDQRFWADRARALRVATKPIPRRKLNGRRLASALRRATREAGMRQRAASLARRIGAEDGVVRAVALVESYASGAIASPSPSPTFEQVHA